MAVRELNRLLQGRKGPIHHTDFTVTNAKGRHSLAVGLSSSIDVTIRGHAGYYCGGMNQHARITIIGNVGTGVGENMMSGCIRVEGDASQSAGATSHGGLLIIKGDAAARCAISLKGGDVVVQGCVGHMSAFMAQSGRLVVCGDAGGFLGDSIYEAEIYVAGQVESLGADCIEKEMTLEHQQDLNNLLTQANINVDSRIFRRYGSARELYHFKVDNAGAY